MSGELILLTLVALIAYQHWFYSREIQKLVDKVMSRDFGEYNRTANPPPIKIKLPEQVIPEDLGPMREFSGF